MQFKSLIIASLLLGISFPSYGKEIIEEEDGIVSIEAEDTSSRLGKWDEKTEIEGYTGTGYLEFSGNTPLSGEAESPLKYYFKIEREGLYFLHLHCARESVEIKGEMRKDVANDCYVRVKGDFDEGPDAEDKHNSNAPLKLLKDDTKFFGGDDKEFSWASGNRLDPGGHNNKRIAVYRFKAGETYQLVVSGRSQLFKLDSIVFRHEDVSVKEVEGE